MAVYTEEGDHRQKPDAFVAIAVKGLRCVAAASMDGKVLVNRAYGLADIERGVPLTTESLLDAGSIRKQFVAAAVLVLVEDAKLSLSDDVREYIPELPDYGHTITVDHLLTHTNSRLGAAPQLGEWKAEGS